MPLASLHSIAFLGLDPIPVEVQVDINPAEKPSLVIVGLPDAVVRESKDRVMAAVKNSQFEKLQLAITVNLAPGAIKKEGAYYDLPIALGLLIALGVIKTEHHKSFLILGELGLGGEVRPIQGALALAMHAKERNMRGVIVPKSNAKEAAAVCGIDVIAVDNLMQAVQYLQDTNNIEPVLNTISSDIFQLQEPLFDFADIQGQMQAKRAIEIAAAGCHNILLCGTPGSGKTMLAKALLGIMPLFTIEESLETTKIHSIAGLLKEGQSVVTQRPFRAPHHTISYAGLIGGGAFPRPGEVSLAHNGVLFLDELPEFSRTTLEVLRQPLEDRVVTISRAQGNFTFPTHFLCIAAMNPCPCGYLGHPDKPCCDSQQQIMRYRSKISGPLLDRIDMHIEVPALRYREMTADIKHTENSATLRQRVTKARDVQQIRFGSKKTNAQMNAREVKQFCVLDEPCHELLRYAIDQLGISTRAYSRILRVARTIADLAYEQTIQYNHLLEALSFRGENARKN